MRHGDVAQEEHLKDHIAEAFHFSGVVEEKKDVVDNDPDLPAQHDGEKVVLPEPDTQLACAVIPVQQKIAGTENEQGNTGTADGGKRIPEECGEQSPVAHFSHSDGIHAVDAVVDHHKKYGDEFYEIDGVIVFAFRHTVCSFE